MSSNSGAGRYFLFTPVQKGPGAHTAPIQWVLRSFSAVKRPEHVADHLTPIQCRGSSLRTTTPRLSSPSVP